jgi:hypothetical protein
MSSDEPELEPETEQLVERVERLEERMAQFEQRLRSLPEPPAESQDMDTAAAPPDACHNTTQEHESHENAPEA